MQEEGTLGKSTYYPYTTAENISIDVINIMLIFLGCTLFSELC